MTCVRLVPAAMSLILALVSAGAAPAQARTRSCTASERAAATRALFEIATDHEARNAIAARHLPFGAHQAALAAENEVLYLQHGYAMVHDGDLRTALWVSYRLTRQDVAEGEGKDRVNCFRPDPRLDDSHSARLADYEDQGFRQFDQGHLANDADLKGDLLQQVNTYVLSNMSPQHDCFNRGIWMTLEDLGRRWATRYGEVLITSGAIFDRDFDRRRDPDAAAVRMQSDDGQSRVAVPSAYYKLFLRQDGERWRGIGFQLRHSDSRHGIAWRDVRPSVVAATVSGLAAIEEPAGLVLHPGLDRAALDLSIDGSLWDLAAASPNLEGTCRPTD